VAASDWPGHDSPPDAEEYPGGDSPVRPVGSRPWASVLSAPLGIIVGLVILCVAVPLLCWLLWVLVLVGPTTLR